MFKRFAKLRLHAVAFVITLMFAAVAYADLPPQFIAKAVANLCPEYRYGGVNLEVKYSIGFDQTLFPATVLSQNVDALNNKVSFILEFPSTYGVLPFNVQVFCSNAFGVGQGSNALSISNCDRLFLYDTDGDGIPNSYEDTNCDNFFSPGDLSNPDNVDTDGDGVRDLVEVLLGFDPAHPGLSPYPFIFSSAPFDPDHNNTSNPIVWRGSTGTFFIKDFPSEGSNTSFPFGLPGDLPFTYQAATGAHDVGVVRLSGLSLLWFFRGDGFQLNDGSFLNSIAFGIFGDNILLGAWEKPGITNPAVARLYNGQWWFYILLSDGTVRGHIWGGNGDIPKVEDHDGDGLVDVTVFRPSEQKTYIIRSSDGGVDVFNFGTGTADHTVRGDYTGDGIDDISFWEPISGMFTMMTSDNGFDDKAAREGNANYYKELQLGLYNIHLPLNWNLRQGKLLLTVVHHQTGLRYWRENNSGSNPPISLQWGLPGDHQG